MRGNASVSGLVVHLAVVTALAGGCDTPQAVQDEIACTNLCGCFAVDQEECVAECIVDFSPVADDCAICITTFANECSMLLDECETPCSGGTQALEIEGGGSR